MNSDSGTIGSGETIVEKKQDIPRTIDIYRLKGIVGRLFGIRPMRCRLIWETGEWDPVKSEEDGWSCSEEEEFPRQEEAADERSGAGKSDDLNKKQGVATREQEQRQKEKEKEKKKEKKKQWTRREIELEDSTRDVGFWIEVREAVVRVERR